jgi:hypothetical protein
MKTLRPSVALAAAATTPHRGGGEGTAGNSYRPGVCNIGPEEIARRRRAGHVGLIATVAVLAVLIAVHAPPLVRLVVFLPAAAAAIGYLQARFRFCAGFASRGVYNFGAFGPTTSVDDPEAAARDRSMALRLALASAAIGAVVAIAAALLPL